jgi:ankyrin repeat protein
MDLQVALSLPPHQQREHLVGACLLGHLEEVRWWLSLGVPGYSLEPSEFDEDPLFHAVRGNHLPVVRELLQRGAPVNATFAFGWTSLHHACFQMNPNLIRVLLSYGADLDAHTHSGDIPEDKLLDREPHYVECLTLLEEARQGCSLK